jgi:hypothetical protein
MRAVALLLFAAEPACAQTQPPGIGGVVVAVENAPRCFDTRDHYFMPAPADVGRLEALLPGAIASVANRNEESYASVMARRLLKHLATDKRFFVGVDRRYVDVRGFCPYFVRGDDCPPRVDDGGDCVWFIRFDIKRGTFDQFHTNST